MNFKTIRNSLILILTALIWGVAFVAQSEGMDYVGPYTFTFTRSIIAAFFLLPICFFILKKKNNHLNKKDLILSGIFCGLALGIASLFQQIGIQYTSVGKAGFITAFYIIIVPILGLFFKKKINKFIGISLILAIIGLYFLTIQENFSINFGDFLIFLCAIVFSFHILIIDHYSSSVNGILMSCIQFFIVSLICLIPMLLLEKPSFNDLINAWQPILYAGLFSSGVGYTLQIIGQKDMNPTVASLILSLESVFSVLAGFLILGQSLSLKETIGCILVFCAIILAQLPSPEQKKSSSAKYN